ncbi:hypothetical protein [Thermovibrio ammonificans]|jgi:hypothetical protein|uniref:Uncharacterized protein n=1 Tax=Thermovibrio ammonificans (strain DSM 15698 / JCM 12110 / HB-1) TaxID=648996 RepID=E8T4X6_THEA1|nr:hypothetical protein [Thermovibrio ammonificans]ADU97508.1 hypothetical protein Theam_1549 [Thermovibrio ammonificans HB-1]
MERIKQELQSAYNRHRREGLSHEEALSRAIVEVREKHDSDSFKRALEEFLNSFKPENLTEADPVTALIEAAYEEYELLLPKVKALFKRK